MKSFTVYGAKFIKLNFPGRKIYYSSNGFALHIYGPEQGWGEFDCLIFCNCCYYSDKDLVFVLKKIKELNNEDFAATSFEIARKWVKRESVNHSYEYNFYSSTKEFYNKKELSNLLG